MLVTFLSGFATATFLACGLFFLKFWLASKDRFFLLFSGAFALIGVERLIGFTLFALSDYDQAYSDEIRNWLYLVRLLAFLLILTGIIQKNRASRG